MITRKYITDIPDEVLPYIDQFSVALRVGYNRLREGKSLSASEQYIKTQIENIDLLDSSLIKMAVNKAKNLISKDRVVVFGGYKNLQKRAKNKITKEEWHNLRNSSILLRGSSSDNCGNRKCKLDMAHNRILFRPNRSTEIAIKLPHLSNKTKKDLLLLQSKCELHEACFSLEITRNSVNIIYDERDVKNNYRQIVPISNRILSLDLNPNYIACVVQDSDKIIHKEMLDFSLSNKLNNTNKRKHWILEASKHIIKLCAHYRCNIAIEKINIKSKNHQKGKTFNRLVNNLWNKNILINNLKKRANLLNISCFEIYCAYSSFVGQMRNSEDYDSIAAAIEIGSRGLIAARSQKYEVLPKTLDLSQLSNQWKEVVVANGINSWLEFYNFLKNTKTSYRVLFTRSNYSGISFNLITCNSSVFRHIITYN